MPRAATLSPHRPRALRRTPADASAKGAGPAQRGMAPAAAIFRATPLERIDMIRQGVPAAAAKQIFAALALPQGEALRALGLPAATVNKKAKRGAALSSEESERVIGFARLLGQIEVMVQESGDPTGFDTQAWIARWLTEPLPALGGARPADLMDTMEGQALVAGVAARLQSGAYA